jgi:hypothetical protein
MVMSLWSSIDVAALQEPLGLRLESKRLPVDVPIVDHAELPSDNQVFLSRATNRRRNRLRHHGLAKPLSASR